MYLSHFNLREKPFQLSPDPKFLWLGEQHKEALATLEYGIRTAKGFILLTGDVGTGKTTLINATIKRWVDSSVIASVTDPLMEKRDFYNFLARSFKMDRRFKSKGDFLVKFSHLIFNIYKNNKKLVLIIDEAQRLNHELLEEIRHLSNIETKNIQLLSIILAGQNELIDILRQDINRPIRQRISINYHLKPLSKNDTREYIRHRLKIAGTDKKIFKANALPGVMSFSKGYPRLINAVCDHALLTAYVKGVKEIDAKIIKECARDLRLPGEQEQESSKISKWVAKNRIKPTASPKSDRSFIKKTVAYAAVCVLLLTLFGYFLYSGSPIAIFNKNLRTDNRPQMVRVRIDRDIQSKSLEEPANIDLRAEDDRKLKDSPVSPREIVEKQRLELDENVIATPGKDINQERDAVEPERFPFVKSHKLIIYFGFNSSQLSNDAFEKLAQLAAGMIQQPEIRIVIKGFTDKSGVYSYNKMLSESRANVVRGYLIGKSIEPTRIRTLGIGPVESNKTNKEMNAASLDRRVEIEFDSNT
jgi:general secretion pathway protein A